jgi:hypothetical protein
MSRAPARGKTPLVASPVPGITPALAIDPGGLLEPHFRGSSWDRWRAVLRAAWAEPMTQRQVELFTEVAERPVPLRKVKELWAICGRWAGKDSIASCIAVVAALADYRRYLRPGEIPTILCLANDRMQAEIVQRYVAGYFREMPELRPMVSRETADGLELTNGVAIQIGTNNFRAVRGRTVVCAILDECAFYRSDASSSPDFEVYEALLPTLARVPGLMLIGISSPYMRRGLVYERWQKHYGRDDGGDVLVIKGPSMLSNERVQQSTPVHL